jgi:adenylate cyclase
VAAGSKNALLANDDLTLNAIVQDALKDQDIVYIIIADNDGIIQAHKDMSLVNKRLQRPAELKPLGKDTLIQSYKAPGAEEEVFDISMPLVYSGVRVGSLYLGFSQKTMHQSLADARNRALAIAGAMIGLGIAGAVWLSMILAKPIRALVQGTKAIAQQNFNVQVPVFSRDEIGDLTESFNDMAKSLREKEFIKDAFSKYVAPEVAQEILKNPEQSFLSPKRCEVSVLFCDMRGFTPLAERLPAEAVVAILNEFYGLMFEETFQQAGTLDKFLGDAVMSIFGAPKAYDDHGLRAVKAAMAMRDGMAKLSANRAQESDQPVTIGIGISTGEVVAGTVGAQSRVEYTVIGDRVNLAARLVANALPGQILISSWTYEKVAPWIEARALGPVRVKGKEEEVDVFEVLSMKSANIL